MITNYLNKTRKELIEILKQVEDRIDEIFDNTNSYDEYLQISKPFREIEFYARTAQILNTPESDIILHPHSELDKECLMLIEDFKRSCKLGCIIYSNGFGRYATDTHVTNLTANPRAFKEGHIRPDFKYVCWYNK